LWRSRRQFVSFNRNVTLVSSSAASGYCGDRLIADRRPVRAVTRKIKTASTENGRGLKAPHGPIWQVPCDRRKGAAADLKRVMGSLCEPNFLLKTIPHVNGNPRICELVEYYLEDVDLKGAWTGPASLNLSPHALAPLTELPVLEVVSATHIVADLTLGLGKVAYDYLASSEPSHRRVRSYEPAE
jgi:hypothetical protein